MFGFSAVIFTTKARIRAMVMTVEHEKGEQ